MWLLASIPKMKKKKKEEGTKETIFTYWKPGPWETLVPERVQFVPAHREGWEDMTASCLWAAMIYFVEWKHVSAILSIPTLPNVHFLWNRYWASERWVRYFKNHCFHSLFAPLWIRGMKLNDHRCMIWILQEMKMFPECPLTRCLLFRSLCVSDKLLSCCPMVFSVLGFFIYSENDHIKMDSKIKVWHTV